MSINWEAIKKNAKKKDEQQYEAMKKDVSKTAQKSVGEKGSLVTMPKVSGNVGSEERTGAAPSQPVAENVQDGEQRGFFDRAGDTLRGTVSRQESGYAGALEKLTAGLGRVGSWIQDRKDEQQAEQDRQYLAKYQQDLADALAAGDEKAAKTAQLRINSVKYRLKTNGDMGDYYDQVNAEAVQKLDAIADKKGAEADAAFRRAKDGAGVLGGLAVDAGSALADVLGDAGANILVPGLGTAGRVVRGFGNASEAAEEKGFGLGTQMLYGAGMAGIGEGVNRLFGGNPILEKATGKGALDDLIMPTLGKTLPGRMVKSGLGEGIEEGTEDILDALYQRVLLGEKADPFSWKETGYDALVGGIVGGLTGISGPKLTDENGNWYDATGKKNPGGSMVFGQNKSPDTASDGHAAAPQDTVAGSELSENRVSQIRGRNNGKIEETVRVPELRMPQLIDPMASTANKAAPNNTVQRIAEPDIMPKLTRHDEGQPSMGRPFSGLSQKQREGKDIMPKLSDPLAKPSNPQINRSGLNVDDDIMPKLDDGLGAANVNSLNTDYDRLQAQSDSFHPEGANAARPVDVPIRDFAGQRVSKSASTVMGAEAIPDSVIPQLEQMVADGQLSYASKGDSAAINNARRLVADNGFDGALERFRFAVTSGKVSKDTVVLGQTLMNNAANAGDGKALAEILSLYQSLNTNAGQAVQAASILRKLSPEAQLYGIQKTVSSMNDNLQKAQRDFPGAEIDTALIDKFLAQTDQAGRDAVMEEIYQNVADQVPSTWRDKWNAWRYLAMLGNPRTHIRNIVGNVGFQPVRIVKDKIATAMEAAFSAAGLNVERTKSFVVSPALYRAAWNDYSNAAGVLGGSKYDNVRGEIQNRRRVFNTGVLEAARKGNGAALELEDAVFKRITYADALAGYLQANGVTAAQMESGQMDSTLLSRARDYAAQEALKATYQDSNVISERTSRIAKSMGIVGDAVMPFQRTPANILSRALEYSPAGLIKSLTRDLAKVKAGKMSASQAMDNIAAGLTGSGLFGLGMHLFALGLVTGGQDSGEDDKWSSLLGHQGYALELPGGTSITLDWLAPESLPFFMGVEFMSAVGEDGFQTNDIIDAVKSVANPMLELSMLQGVNDLIESVQFAEDKPLMAIIPSVITSYFSQAVPTLFGQLERSGESIRMTTYTDKNSSLHPDIQYAIGRASSRIPGLDYTQIPYIDAWGREEESGDLVERTVNNLLNPAYVSQVEVDDVERELQRLRDATGETSVFPDRAERYITVDSERKDLTAKEYVSYAKALGQERYNLIRQAISSPAYRTMSDSDKTRYIDRIYDYSKQIAKSSVSGYTVDPWVENARNAQRDIRVSPVEYMALYEKYGSDIMCGNTYEKVKTAVSIGLTVDEYADAKRGLDANKNGSVTQEEAQAYLDRQNFSQKQKADMWTLINKSWKKNPYK